MAHIININAACRNIGGNQDADFTRAKLFQSSLALVLAFIAVNSAGRLAIGFKMRRNLICAALGAGEDNRAFEIRLREKLNQNSSFGGCIAQNHLLADPLGRCCDRRDRDLHRIAQHFTCKASNLFRHCCREEEALAAFGGFGNDFADRNDEAQIKHMISLIQDQNFHRIEQSQALLHKINQTSRCGDQNINARREGLRLCAHAHATNNNSNAQTGKATIGLEGIANLHRQFPGGGEHEHAGLFGDTRTLVRDQSLNDRQRKGGRLACAGLRNAKQIAAL